MSDLGGPHLVHDACLYGSDEELLGAMVPFVHEGLGRGQATVVITSAATTGLLREGLGADSERVRYIDGADWYLRPAAAIAHYDEALRELTEAGVASIRVVAQLPSSATAEERVLWTRYEAMVNRLFARSPLWVVCLYDRRALPPSVVEDAVRTHPTLWEADRRHASRGYVQPTALLGEIPEPSPPAADQPALRLLVDDDRPGWRREVRAAIVEHGLSGGRADEFMVATSEVVTNALQHGSGRARLGLWAGEGRVVCEVQDDGGGLDDPYAGYLPPGSEDAARGMGLWIARQLCDALAIRSGPHGTTVRLAVSR
jgi:anti-sigma regulatory factor (Ser/Thr protein kinase)